VLDEKDTGVGGEKSGCGSVVKEIEVINLKRKTSEELKNRFGVEVVWKAKMKEVGGKGD